MLSDCSTTAQVGMVKNLHVHCAQLLFSLIPSLPYLFTKHMRLGKRLIIIHALLEQKS